MKVLLIFIFLIFIIWQLESCQTGPSIKIVFESNSPDTATVFDEIKNYKLKEKAINSDFNYPKLDDIDDSFGDTLSIKSVKSIFEPIRGHFVYYQFVATFKGNSFEEVDKDFHDILIIKTDNSDKILDAYQYTLEWAEPPLQDDLYKYDNKGLTLKNNLPISILKLTRKDFWNEKERISKKSGRIILE